MAHDAIATLRIWDHDICCVLLRLLLHGAVALLSHGASPQGSLEPRYGSGQGLENAFTEARARWGRVSH